MFVTTRALSRAAPACALALLASLAGCGPAEETKVEPVRPVRVVTVERSESGETVSLAGQIQAEEGVNLSFRVGDRVTAGQVVAVLESEPA